MPIDLSERVCIVTGAAAGIGQAVARGFALRGAKVVATDREEIAWEGAAMKLRWDVTDASRGEQVMREIEAAFGRVDALVANAGMYPKMPWDEMTREAWRQVLSVNLDGAWYSAQAAAKVMRPRGYGKIVTVSSVLVAAARGEEVHYTAAKAGIIGLTRSLARALGRDGIRVNCIMPGAVRVQREIDMYPDQPAIAKMLAEMQCLPHRLEPPAIEPAFAFLCSAESDAITGQVLCVDHGLVHW